MAFRFCLVLYAALLVSGSQAFLEEEDDQLQLTASLTAINSPDDPLTLVCTFDPAKHPDVVSLLNIRLSQRPLGTDTFKVLATLTGKELRKADDFQGSATGELNKDLSKVSSMTAVIDQPGQGERGEYQCVSTGVDNSDMMSQSRGTVTVGAEVKSLDEVAECFKYEKPLASLTEAKAALQKCGANMDKWFETLRDVAEKLGKVHLVYGVTELYDEKSFYVITRENLNFGNAKKVCSDNFGYLAEINTEAEYNFLNRALLTAKALKTQRFSNIVTGASYPALDAPFELYTHTDKAPVYTGHWAPKEPHRLYKNFNWLMLKFYRGAFLMADGSNFQFPNQAYLCEVSKDI